MRLLIDSLKDRVGAQRCAYVVGCDEAVHDNRLKKRQIEWNVPVKAEIGDLVIMYRNAPTSAIADLREVAGSPKRYEKGNRGGYWPGVQAPLRRVAKLKTPLTFEKLSRGLAGTDTRLSPQSARSVKDHPPCDPTNPAMASIQETTWCAKYERASNFICPKLLLNKRLWFVPQANIHNI